MSRNRPTKFVLAAVVTGALALGAGGTAQAATGQMDVTGPAGSGAFGTQVVVLSNGNVVVTDPGYDIDGSLTDVGAVYLYNGATHQLISTITGSTKDDRVGNPGVTVLSNGNYVIKSQYWSIDGTTTSVGAVTWASATAGVSGTVSSANSLVGSTTDDKVGAVVTALTNGNYIVNDYLWDADGTHTDVGAVTWGNGTTGTSGTVSVANSLVGATTNDKFGLSAVALANGNYVAESPLWDLDGTHTNVGAVTWGNGATGTFGAVTAANSLTGSSNSDTIGSGSVTALTTGHYVILSRLWDIDGGNTNVGAVTWGNGITGGTRLAGIITSANSILGTNASTGSGMVVDYDYANDQIVVGRPGDNTLTWLAVEGAPSLPPTGGNVDLFLWVGASLLAAGALLHGTQRRLRFARNG